MFVPPVAGTSSRACPAVRAASVPGEGPATGSSGDGRPARYGIGLKGTVSRDPGRPHLVKGTFSRDL